MRLFAFLPMLALASCGDAPIEMARAITQVDNSDSSSTDSSIRGLDATPASLRQIGAHSMGWQELPIDLWLDAEFNDHQVEQIVMAAETWNEAIDPTSPTLVVQDQRITLDKNVGIQESLEDGINTIYLQPQWENTRKINEVIGTTTWHQSTDHEKLMATADVALNAEFFQFTDAETVSKDERDRQEGALGGERREIVDLITLMIHELGHVLGLIHVDYRTPSVMNNGVAVGIGQTRRKLTALDKERVQFLYGKPATQPHLQNFSVPYWMDGRGDPHHESCVGVLVDEHL